MIVSPRLAEYLRRNTCDYCGSMEHVRTFIAHGDELPEIHICPACWDRGIETKIITYETMPDEGKGRGW